MNHVQRRRDLEGRSNRRALRLADHDYSQPGAYFVTIVTQKRECFFGEVIDCEMKLNQAGNMVAEIWRALPRRFPNLVVDNS